MPPLNAVDNVSYPFPAQSIVLFVIPG